MGLNHQTFQPLIVQWKAPFRIIEDKPSGRRAIRRSRKEGGKNSKIKVNQKNWAPKKIAEKQKKSRETKRQERKAAED